MFLYCVRIGVLRFPLLSVFLRSSNMCQGTTALSLWPAYFPGVGKRQCTKKSSGCPAGTIILNPRQHIVVFPVIILDVPGFVHGNLEYIHNVQLAVACKNNLFMIRY